jgi:hypothetical protein
MSRLHEQASRGDYAAPPNLPVKAEPSASLPARASGGNPFLSFAASESGQNILGKLIRFSKGDYLAGESEIPVGTDFHAAVDGLVVGWVRWLDRQQAERRLGRLADGFVEPAREELGHLEEGQWERDAEGRPQDPWSKVRYLPMKRMSDGELFTLALNGKGRSGEAMGRLCGAYGRSQFSATDFPVIRLNVDSYPHKTYGRIKFPLLSLVGWRSKSEFGALETGAPGDDAPGAPKLLEADAIPF